MVNNLPVCNLLPTCPWFGTHSFPVPSSDDKGISSISLDAITGHVVTQIQLNPIFYCFYFLVYIASDSSIIQFCYQDLKGSFMNILWFLKAKPNLL